MYAYACAHVLVFRVIKSIYKISLSVGTFGLFRKVVSKISFEETMLIEVLA